jgi:hypothetical protein
VIVVLWFVLHGIYNANSTLAEPSLFDYLCARVAAGHLTDEGEGRAKVNLISRRTPVTFILFRLAKVSDTASSAT